MPSSSRSARGRRRSARSIRISTCTWSAARPAPATCTNRASRTERFCRLKGTHRAHGRRAMTDKNFKVDEDGDGIALVTWDMAGRSMNVIDMDVIAELTAIVDRVANDAAIKGAVVTSGKDTFSGGADLTMLEGLNQGFANLVRSQ